MNQHHLLLGQLEDFLTGQTIDDTHDERYRQKIARFLVTQKGFAKSEICRQHPLWIKVDSKCARVTVTFCIAIGELAAMIVHYGPGSLVTRHRPALAMARLIAPHQIPMVVVTNGEDADILDGATGRLNASGMENLPSRTRLAELIATVPKQPIAPPRTEMEARILMAYEVDDRCPCDDDACILEPRRS